MMVSDDLARVNADGEGWIGGGANQTNAGTQAVWDGVARAEQT